MMQNIDKDFKHLKDIVNQLSEAYEGKEDIMDDEDITNLAHEFHMLGNGLTNLAIIMKGWKSCESTS